MPQLGQAQTVTSTLGNLKSTPKLTKINGDDDKKVIYRNLGNNHAYPFIWASTVTLTSGIGPRTETIADGIKWHGYDLATYASVVATPKGDVGDFYTTADESANTITLTCKGTLSEDVEVALMFMLGDEMVVEGLVCRGNIGAAQSLP